MDDLKEYRFAHAKLMMSAWRGTGVHRQGGSDEGDSHGGLEWRRGNLAWHGTFTGGHAAISRHAQHGHRAVSDCGRRR
jgi:hypothetical protein